MKTTAILTLLVASVWAQDCDEICATRHADLVREKDELWHSREGVIREKDELWHSREGVIKEKDELWHSRENIIREKDQFFHEKEGLLAQVNELKGELDRVNRESEASARQLAQVDELKATIEKQEADMTHYQTVAQDNQKYMMEYKNQLASQRDRSAKLDIALKEAEAKIDELENAGLFKTIQKSLVGAFVSIKGKGKGEEF